jgi:putative NADPH-quinone reductase
MAKILIVDGGVPFHGVGGTLNHSYAELAQKTLTAMGHDAVITRVDGKWQAAEE